MENTPRSLVVEAYEKTPVDDEMFEESSWIHPWHSDGAIVLPYIGKRSPPDLFVWASIKNYYPVFLEPAWDYYKRLITRLDKYCMREKKLVKTEVLRLEMLESQLLEIGEGN
jgi:hypothetical protein